MKHDIVIAYVVGRERCVVVQESSSCWAISCVTSRHHHDLAGSGSQSGESFRNLVENVRIWVDKTAVIYLTYIWR